MIGEIITIFAFVFYPICSFVIARYIKNSAIDDVLGYLESEEGLKYVYKLGVVAGSGLRQGIGLSKGKGKFSLEGVVMEAVGGFVENIANKYLGGGQEQSGQQQQKPKERRSVPKM